MRVLLALLLFATGANGARKPKVCLSSERALIVAGSADKANNFATDIKLQLPAKLLPLSVRTTKQLERAGLFEKSIAALAQIEYATQVGPGKAITPIAYEEIRSALKAWNIPMYYDQ